MAANRNSQYSHCLRLFFPVELQYFIPSAKKGINRQIELAILRADKMGVKVISLAALNKVTIGSSLLISIRFRTSKQQPTHFSEHVPFSSP